MNADTRQKSDYPVFWHSVNLIVRQRFLGFRPLNDNFRGTEKT